MDGAAEVHPALSPLRGSLRLGDTRTAGFGIIQTYDMRRFTTALLLLLSASALAAARVAVPSLPEPVRPLAEVETNVVFSTGAAADNKWTLTIERDAAVSNSVEVVFGRDADEDDVLGVEEGELCVGWDCGEWFWRDRRSNAACRVEGTAQRLDMTLYLNRNREAKSLASSVFPAVVSSTFFNTDWNLARVVSRGAETDHVESKVSIDALKLRIR